MKDPRTIVLMAFVFITVATAIAVLAAALGWVPGAAPQLVDWGIPAVLGEIVLTVIVFFKGQWAQSIRINVLFHGTDASDVVLDGAQCHYSITDSSGNVVRKGTVGPSLGHGGWQISLPSSVQSDQSVALSLGAQGGQTWEVRPFLPLVQIQKAYPAGH